MSYVIATFRINQNKRATVDLPSDAARAHKFRLTNLFLCAQYSQHYVTVQYPIPLRFAGKPDTALIRNLYVWTWISASYSVIECTLGNHHNSTTPHK